MRFAGYRQTDMSIKGDPAEVAFTEMLIRMFGWKGPGTDFDILPLVLQPSPTDEPKMFSIPPQYIPEVRFLHPQHTWFASLGLKWYGIPCVSNMRMRLGGLLYTGVPFTGWYADVEILRNLSDESRYNKLSLIAERLGYNTSENSNLWKDAALLVLNQAIVYSFQEAALGIADHHTLMEQFWVWQAEEKAKRGYVSVNWKWVIPPVASSTSRCYLGLSKTTEYTLQPAYVGGPGWLNFAKAHFGPNFDRSPGGFNPGAYASQLAGLTKDPFKVQVLSVKEYEDAKFNASDVIILVTSTYGSGAPPATATRFLSWLSLQGDDPKSPLKGKAGQPDAHPHARSRGKSYRSGWEGDQLGGRETAFREWLGDAFRGVATEQPGIREACEGVQTNLKTLMGGDAGFVARYGLVVLSGIKKLAEDVKVLKGPVLEAKPLFDSTDGRATTLVRIDISSEPLAIYEPGDHIAVAPCNLALGSRLDEVADHLELSLDTVFDLEILVNSDDPDVEDPKKIFPLPNSLRTILTNHVALQDEVNFRAVLPLSMYAKGADEEELTALGGDEKQFQAWQAEEHLRWVDIFDRFPTLSRKLPVEVLLQIAPSIHPRYYSIASSMLASPGEVHVVVGALSYTLPNGKQRFGQCSNYLTQHVKAGDIVRYKLTKVPAFRLPLDTRRPVIMVGAGTGLAPVRGFIQHRKKLRAYGEMGPCVFIFGCRSKQDQICKEEVEAAVASGAISAVLVAYSREPGVKKLYVQQKLKESAAELSAMLEAKDGHVYICDSRMSAEVSAVIAGIIGKEKLTAMSVERRFHDDVFGIVSNAGQKNAAAKALKPEQDTLSDVLRAVPGSSVTERVLKALDHGLRFDVADSAGNTLLHTAVEKNDPELLKALLARKDMLPVLMSLNHWHLTPLALALARRKPELQAVLRAAGGSVVSGMHKDFYPVHAAALTNDAARITELKAEGASLAAADFVGATPVHLAAVLGSADVLALLIEEGCNVNVADRWGQSPLMCALTYSHAGAAALLKGAGARVTASSTFDAWPSMTAWSPSAAAGEGAADAKLSDERILKAQALWDFMEGSAFADNDRRQFIDRGVKVFENLFELAPQVLTLFPFKDENGRPRRKELEVHVETVMSTTGQVVRQMQDPDSLAPMLTELTALHVKYGVELIHYDILCSTFLLTFEQLLGPRWNSDYRDVWISIFSFITTFARKAYE
ncbi:hypothetical protein KFL_006460015 [Klebsormidium nitens]|uniref:Uncharacterized protein n=1 Tax=Klebsormidium nitens TaxID=105231 RepID=A0A1Y1IHX6_KLENI|nr:hypothetical protein KFL_006460015 [Klebsormidium nitens]|eukprot:GAQ90485.1 hypothetical protein KFL_006460015 [Klebsormidium nitens]